MPAYLYRFFLSFQSSFRHQKYRCLDHRNLGKCTQGFHKLILSRICTEPSESHLWVCRSISHRCLGRTAFELYLVSNLYRLVFSPLSLRGPYRLKQADRTFPFLRMRSSSATFLSIDRRFCYCRCKVQCHDCWPSTHHNLGQRAAEARLFQLRSTRPKIRHSCLHHEWWEVECCSNGHDQHHRQLVQWF